jgi:hypothetical protein
MIEDLHAALRPLLPLRVDQLAYQDPVLTFGGEGWSLVLVCPWRLLKGTKVLTAWDDQAVEDSSWELLGHQIYAVRPRIPGNDQDPVFELSGDLHLEVFADTDLDPWVLRLPTQTIVGRSPTGGQRA